ncbi:MAG: polymer-forming cytoskeletal protein [Longimicrobiales bacterium]|nr:polymer-forming cytoskeletal protein [Longimicrobiales bacterium]
MARDRSSSGTDDDVISIIASGMTVTGDCETDGTLRIEGRVEGSVRAAKGVIVGREGVVDGHVVTQDAVISGRVTGSVTAESRLELQGTACIEGDVRALRMQLQEGGEINGTLTMGERIRTEGSADDHGDDAQGEQPLVAPHVADS